MADDTMKTLTINGQVFVVHDDYARTEISKLSKEIDELKKTSGGLKYTVLSTDCIDSGISITD